MPKETLRLLSELGKVCVADRPVLVYQLVNDGGPEELLEYLTPEQMFESLIEDFDRLCFSPEQILQIFTENQLQILGKDGYQVLLLFKENEVFLVAAINVYVSSWPNTYVVSRLTGSNLVRRAIDHILVVVPD